MNNKIEIRRDLSIQTAHMPYYAQYMATQLQEDLGLKWGWTSPCSISFEAETGLAKGTKGTLRLDGSVVILDITLPFMLAAMRPTIERKIDEKLGALVQMAQQAAAAG